MMTEMPVSVVLAILILSRTEHDYFVVIVQVLGGSSIINSVAFRRNISQAESKLTVMPTVILKWSDFIV